MSTFTVKKKELHDGLRVVLIPRQEVLTATLLVLIGTGSRYETDKQAGLSHFLEHMFFKGTEKRPTTKEIAESVDNIGGEFNAFTGEEFTGFYVKVAASQLPAGMDVVADILLNPLFPVEEIERERGVIIEEIRMYSDAPMHHVNHLWQEALFGRHPLGRRIDGSIDTVSQFKRNDFIKYTKKHYHTRNAVVVVSGNYNEGEVMKLLQEMFTTLPAGQETNPRPAPKTIPSQKVLAEVRNNLDQTHMIVGVPGVKIDDERRFAANLLAIILGGGMSSRLFLSVRERNGLAYAVRTSLQAYVDTGSFATQLGVRSDKADQALSLVLEEYDRVMNEVVSKEELNKAKEMVKGRLLLDLEETNALAQYSGMQELLQKKITTPEELMKNYNAVTADQIMALAREILVRRKRAVVVLGPKKPVQQVQRQAEKSLS
jgi:predicted Zn-dependent peptidase